MGIRDSPPSQLATWPPAVLIRASQLMHDQDRVPNGSGARQLYLIHSPGAEGRIAQVPALHSDMLSAIKSLPLINLGQGGFLIFSPGSVGTIFKSKTSLLMDLERGEVAPSLSLIARVSEAISNLSFSFLAPSGCALLLLLSALARLRSELLGEGVLFCIDCKVSSSEGRVLN